MADLRHRPGIGGQQRARAVAAVIDSRPAAHPASMIVRHAVLVQRGADERSTVES
jgi:hypothetical protein